MILGNSALLAKLALEGFFAFCSATGCQANLSERS